MRTNADPGSSFLRIALAACAIMVTLLGSAGSAVSQMLVIGYYPMWARATLPASQVKLNYLTHVCHAFAWPLADCSITSYDTVLDTAIINTTHRAGRKILISLGGAAESTNFPAIVADTAKRHLFVRNVVSYLKNNGYDGADLDWEGPSTVADRANEVGLLRELHAAMAAENPAWIITMAVGVSNWSGQWRNFDSLKVYVDCFNAMCYDFHGSWSNHAGHNAPLYAPPTDYDGCDDQGITYLTVTRGIPTNQVALGMPFYGKEFLASAMYAPSSGETDLAYPDILYRLAHNWTYIWDTLSQVPYLTSPSMTKVVSFDDSASLTLKCQYARMKQLGGVMIWEITQDVVGLTQPLMEAVGLAIYGTSDVIQTRRAGEVDGYTLSANYPNPFNPSTEISYRLPAVSFVTLKVFDILGREVAGLVNETESEGMHTVRFDASSNASSVYFYRIMARSAGGGRTFVETRPMVLAK